VPVCAKKTTRLEIDFAAGDRGSAGVDTRIRGSALLGQPASRQPTATAENDAEMDLHPAPETCAKGRLSASAGGSEMRAPLAEATGSDSLAGDSLGR